MSEMKAIIENWRKYTKKEAHLINEACATTEECLNEYKIHHFLADVEKYTGLGSRLLQALESAELPEDPNEASKIVKWRNKFLATAKNNSFSTAMGMIGAMGGTVLPGGGTTAGAAVGYAGGKIIEMGAKKILDSLGTGLGRLFAKSQVDDASQSTPAQKILDLNDELESLMKGGSKTEKGTLYASYINWVGKMLKRISEEIKQKLDEIEYDSPNNNRDVNQVKWEFLNSPIKPFFVRSAGSSVNQWAENFIETWQATQNIKIDAPAAG